MGQHSLTILLYSYINLYFQTLDDEKTYVCNLKTLFNLNLGMEVQVQGQNHAVFLWLRHETEAHCLKQFMMYILQDQQSYRRQLPLK